MCPDPYDYSGPVPNGSSPQNDFRARSNGILPIGAAPRPWPPIVRHGSDSHGAQGLARRTGVPTPAPEAVALVAAETAVEPTEARSVLGVVGSEEPDVESPPRDPWAVVPDFDVASVPAVGDSQTSTDDPPGDPAASQPPIGAPAVTVELPTLTETPGWRQRTPR